MIPCSYQRQYIEDLIRFIFQPLVLFSILQPFLWLFAATLAKWLHSRCIVELIKSTLGIFLSLSWIFNLSGNLHFSMCSISISHPFLNLLTQSLTLP